MSATCPSPPARLLLALVLTACPVFANDDRDHERARAQVEDGRHLPLSAILAQVEARFGGRVLEIERERKRGREIYEIDLLDEHGRVLELEVDAASGEILRSEYDD